MKTNLHLLLLTVALAITPAQAQTTPPTPINLTLTGTTPILIPPASGQTIPQLLLQVQASVQSGTIHGNLSGIGKPDLVAVFDNADLGAATLNGVTLTPTSVGVIQAAPGDTDFNGTVDINDYNDLMAGMFGGWTNGPNWVVGDFLSQGNITQPDWLLLDLAYKLATKP